MRREREREPKSIHFVANTVQGREKKKSGLNNREAQAIPTPAIMLRKKQEQML
jgi:hypothetical protein